MRSRSGRSTRRLARRRHLPRSPDPDIVLYNNGFLDIAESTTVGDEIADADARPGEYVIEVYEWSHVDPTYSAAERRGNTCFNVTVTG